MKNTLAGVTIGLVCALALMATSVAPAADGGNVVIGAVNTGSSRTQLLGNAANAGLRVANDATSNAPAIVGVSVVASRPGLQGDNTAAGGSGVIGTGGGGGNGLRGVGLGTGTGVKAESPSGFGVNAVTGGNVTRPAVNGESTSADGIGVRGVVTTANALGGLFENNTAGAGTAGTGLVALGRAHDIANVGIGPDGFDGAIEAAGPNGIEGNSTQAGGFGVSGDGPAVGVNGTATETGGRGGNFTGGATGIGVDANGGATGLEASGSEFGVDASVTTAAAVGVRSTTGTSANDAVQGFTSGGISDAIQGTTTGAAAFAVFAIGSGGGTGVVSSTGSGGGTAVSASSGAGTGVAASNGSATNAAVLATNSTASGTAGRFTGDTGVDVNNNGTSGIGLLATVDGNTDGLGTADDDANQAGNFRTDDTNSPNTLQADNGGVASDAFTAEAIEAFGFVDINGSARVTGNLEVTGTCCGPMIDNPSDPKNSTLRHAGVSSSAPTNMYNGVVTTDATGTAIVPMPEWFGLLNKDFTYQLTTIGTFARAIVLTEIPAGGRTFTIKTDQPAVKVSWMVTGVRNDAYAIAHPFTVIEPKLGAAKGMYLHPELFGFPNATPLGLDMRTITNEMSAASLKAQADEAALIARKTAEALADAKAANAPRVEVPQQSQQ